MDPVIVKVSGISRHVPRFATSQLAALNGWRAQAVFSVVFPSEHHGATDQHRGYQVGSVLRATMRIMASRLRFVRALVVTHDNRKFRVRLGWSVRREIRAAVNDAYKNNVPPIGVARSGAPGRVHQIL
jgi:hypothetical protein